MTTTEIEARKRATFDKSSTAELIKSLRHMGSLDALNPNRDNKMVIAWIRTELERRYPQASQAVEDAFLAASAQEEQTGEYVDVAYDDVLITAIEKTA